MTQKAILYIIVATIGIRVLRLTVSFSFESCSLWLKKLTDFKVSQVDVTPIARSSRRFESSQLQIQIQLLEQVVPYFPLNLLPLEIILNIVKDSPLNEIKYLLALFKLPQTITYMIAGQRISRILSKFFTKLECKEFITVLKLAGAIVGGSSILSVVRPANWTPDDLDLVVTAEGQYLLFNFLQTAGYIWEDTHTGYVMDTTSIAFKYAKWTKGGRKIDVCTALCLEVADFIL